MAISVSVQHGNFRIVPEICVNVGDTLLCVRCWVCVKINQRHFMLSATCGKMLGIRSILAHFCNELKSYRYTHSRAEKPKSGSTSRVVSQPFRKWSAINFAAAHFLILSQARFVALFPRFAPLRCTSPRAQGEVLNFYGISTTINYNYTQRWA